MGLETIDTIIFVMMENRSFDHMLGYLSLAGPKRLPVDGLQSSAEWRRDHANVHLNTAYPSKPLAPTVQAIDDPPHNWAAIKQQIETPTAGGFPMGGFVSAYAAEAPAQLDTVMGYYTQDAVPTFDFFARNFVVCDHWFAALPAGTQPNRLMAMSGKSDIAENSHLFLPNQELVYDWLNRNRVSWCAYQWGGFFPFFALHKKWLPDIIHSLTFKPSSGKFRRYSHFAETWASAKAMPRVIFIEPEYGDGPHSDPNDDHPPTGVAKGQAFLADVYATLISNPARWARTMMVVTYDEHGGFFDHVPPIEIHTTAGDHAFTTTGVRVPAFVISPQVGAGEVYRGLLDHTSFLQLLAEKFTPGHGYSIPVNDRQGRLHRLSDVLKPPEAQPRTPTMPHARRSGVRALAAAAPLAPPVGASPRDSANAQALHKVAETAVAEFPEVQTRPEWAAVRQYLERSAR